MEKEVIEKVHELLNTSSWDAEYCTPHKWKDEDMDKCISVLEHTIFSLSSVSMLMKDWEEEIYDMTNDYDDASLVSSSLHFIADSLAWDALLNKDVKYPDSATFKVTKS